MTWLADARHLAVCAFVLAVSWSHVSTRPACAWTSDPTVNSAVCVDTTLDQAPLIAAAPDGSTAILWVRNSPPGTQTLRLQRLSREGVALWPRSGFLVDPDGYIVGTRDLLVDAQGSIYVSWTSFGAHGLRQHVRVQKFSPSGARLWGPDGVLVTTVADQASAPIVLDGRGGVFVGWTDARITPYNNDTVQPAVQHLDARGHAVWTPSGVLMSSGTGHLQLSALVSDSAGGVIGVWSRSFLGNPDIEGGAQRVTSAGTVAWNTEGVSLAPGLRDREVPIACADGEGGLYTAWADEHPGVVVQHLDAAGSAMWGGAGVFVTDVEYPEGYWLKTQLALLPDHTVVVAWVNLSEIAAVRAQRLAADGTAWWGSSGLTVHSFDPYFGNAQVQVLARPDGDCAFTWNDLLSNVMLQVLEPDGSVSAGWPAEGIAATTNPAIQNMASFAVTRDGIIAVWTDQRAGWGNPDLYAQRVLWSGAYGAPVVEGRVAATIANVSAPSSSLRAMPAGASGLSLQLSLAHAGHATVRAFDMQGRCLGTVLDAERPMGAFETGWVSKVCGIVLLRLSLNGELVASARVMVLR